MSPKKPFENRLSDKNFFVTDYQLIKIKKEDESSFNL